MAKKNELSPRSLQILIMFADGASMKPLCPIKDRDGKYICVPNVNHTRALIVRKFLKLCEFSSEVDGLYQAWVISEDGKEHAKLHGWATPREIVIVEPPLPDDATERLPVVWTPEDDVSQALDQLTVNLMKLEFPSAAVTPNTHPNAFMSVMVYTQDRTPYMTLIPKAPFETGLVYDQPAPKYVFPLVIDTASWKRMVDAELAHQDAEKMHTVLSGVFETGLMYDQPQEEPLRFKIGEMAIDNFGNLVTISKIKTDGPYPLYGFGNDHWCHADWLTRIDPLNTGMLYDQPQPFTFDFKRGDVVEFQFAFPRTPAHKGWLKGVFYNVYPGDSRYACIRREGIYEAARLADIRKPLPVVTDIFDGMGDFVVKAPDSAKAA